MRLCLCITARESTIRTHHKLLNRQRIFYDDANMGLHVRHNYYDQIVEH